MPTSICAACLAERAKRQFKARSAAGIDFEVSGSNCDQDNSAAHPSAFRQIGVCRVKGQLTQKFHVITYALRTSTSTCVPVLELKVKVVPSPPGGRRGVAGFYVQHFSVSTVLCDGGAYLISVVALPLPPTKEGGYSFTASMLM